VKLCTNYAVVFTETTRTIAYNRSNFCKKKNNYKPVSRILFHPVPAEPRQNKAIIYLAPALLPGSFCLPTQRSSSRLSRGEDRTSRPSTLVYMAFQHARFTLPICYHTGTWALTPHFHPYPVSAEPRQDGYFLWHFLFPALLPGPGA
jgi:hypothetical protein